MRPLFTLLLLVVLAGCGSDHESDAGSSGAAGQAAPMSGSGTGGRTTSAAGGGGRGAAGGTSGSAGSRAPAGGSSGAGAGGGGDEMAGGGAGATGGAGDAGAGGATVPIPTRCSEVAAEAPSTTWVNATGSLAGMASECGNLTLVAAHPCSDLVIAGVAKAGLYATTDAGGSWTKLGTGAGSASLVHRPSSIVFDPEDPQVFYETGIYGAGGDGVFVSRDAGETLEPLGTIGHIDLVSVDFGDPERKTLLAGVHETKRALWLSRDGGASWNDIGASLPADSHFSSAPLLLSTDRFLLGVCGWGDGTCGVLASEDGGESWDSRSNEAPAGAPLFMADGHLVWPTIYGSGAILSDDSGESWTKVDGPRSTPVELPDGRIVAVGGDHLVLSDDAGATWSNLGEPLPYQAAGVAYSRSRKTFFIWHNDCGDAVLPDAIMSAGFMAP